MSRTRGCERCGVGERVAVGMSDERGLSLLVISLYLVVQPLTRLKEGHVRGAQGRAAPGEEDRLHPACVCVCACVSQNKSRLECVSA